MAPLAGSKERALFAQVVKNYENKQFKKGRSESSVINSTLTIAHRFKGGRSDPP